MVKNPSIFSLILLLLTFATCTLAQERKDKTAVTYEEIYDEPYSINKLFVHFQPLYGELFATNTNAGFGIEANYFLENKMNFKAHFRKTYSRQFFDFNRDLALKTSDVDNAPEIFNYYEIGATYHVKDFEESTTTKMFLYKNSYKGNKWAARVPIHAEVPAKVRKIYGARLGAIIWDSSVDVNRAMRKQGVELDEFVDAEGDPISLEVPEDPDLFTNISSTGLYIGGSMTWIRNVAVNFDKFEAGVDDLIFTTYLDILFAPSLEMDNMIVNGNSYDISPLKVSKFGFRAGVEGKFNRTLSWAYGGEIGYRPSVQGGGFFALIKISFPVFGTNLDYKVESFGK